MDGVGEAVDRDHMKINAGASKCASMLIPQASCNQPPIGVTAKDQVTPQVHSIKLLRATIQGNLRWELYVDNYDQPRANSRKYVALVLKGSGVTLHGVVECYCTFIRPVVKYAVHGWHSGLPPYQSQSLGRVQNKLRIILSIPVARGTGLWRFISRSSTLATVQLL